MKTSMASPLLVAFLLVGMVEAGQVDKKEAAKSVGEAYPGLTPGALSFALIKDMSEDTLLQAGSVRITAKELRAEISKVSESLRSQFRKNTPFFLEQIATPKLLAEVARKTAAEKKIDLSGKSEPEIIQSYLGPFADGVKVGEEEAKEFYEENASLCGGATFAQMKKAIGQYLLQQKKEEAVSSHIRTFGQRIEIAVSASWLKEQAPLARDNPIDKARWSGKPTMVVFSGKSCCGPDQMLPVVDKLRDKHGGRVNIIYMEARQEQILAARCAVRSIPTLIVFGRNGKETYRHAGSQTAEYIDAKLAEAGAE